jgi:hypothetical protein
MKIGKMNILNGKRMKKLKVNIWKDGYDKGINSVLEYLKEVKGLDVAKEFQMWANADKHNKKNKENKERK